MIHLVKNIKTSCMLENTVFFKYDLDKQPNYSQYF